MVKKKSLISKLVPRRTWVQAAFLLVWLDPLGLRFHGMCCPVFHCYACPLATFACPIGVIAQFGAIHVFPFIAVGLLILVGGLVGSLLCGWACPFGFLQDLAAKVPTVKHDPPHWTGHLRYVVLIGAVLAIPYFFGEGHPFFICRVCPAAALESAAPDMTGQIMAGEKIVWPNALKLAVVVLFLIGIFFINRPWCRILCPLGAIFSLFNRASAFFLRFDPARCTDCKRCYMLCEYGVQPDISPNDSRCIRCLECTHCGPEALTFGSVFERREKQKNSTNLKTESSQAKA
ncbi:MAG: 4Fe-4S binding protein [Planctomycetota bacterium]